MVDDIQRQYVESGPSAGPSEVSASAKTPSSSSVNHTVLAERAVKWEKEQEYVQAISCYLKITPEMTTDRRVLEAAWMRAVDLASKFLPQKIEKISEVVASKLQSIDRHTSAARVYLEIEDTKHAIECLIAGNEWNKAKKIAKEMEPGLLRKVEEAYRRHLKEKGNADEVNNNS